MGTELCSWSVWVDTCLHLNVLIDFHAILQKLPCAMDQLCVWNYLNMFLTSKLVGSTTFWRQQTKNQLSISSKESIGIFSNGDVVVKPTPPPNTHTHTHTITNGHEWSPDQWLIYADAVEECAEWLTTEWRKYAPTPSLSFHRGLIFGTLVIHWQGSLPATVCHRLPFQLLIRAFQYKLGLRLFIALKDMSQQR